MSGDHSQERAMAIDVPAPTELLQLIKDDSVDTLLTKIPFMAKILTYTCAVLGVPSTFIPRQNDKAVVIQWFRKLSKQLEQENQDLTDIIKMEALYLRYGQYIVIIQKAISSSVDIAIAGDDAERQRYVQIFKDVCSGQKHTIAMDNLIEGLRGKGTLQINMVDRYYTLTGGNLSKVRSLAKEFLQLVYGGFMAMYTYETLMHDQSFAKKILIKYSDRMKDVQENIQSIFERCKNKLRENMLRDLNDVLDSSVSNSEAVNSLSSLVSEKYDWLENYCIVCNETFPMDCWFEGNYISSLGRKGRFGVVFYQEATRAAVDPGRQQDVARILESFTRAYWRIPEAKDLCRQLIEAFRSNGIETRGCAVIKPKTSFVYSSLYTVYHGFLDYANTIGFQKKGNSLTTVHCCRQSYILGPKVMHFIIQWKQPTNYSPVNLEISYNLTDDAVIIN